MKNIFKPVTVALVLILLIGCSSAPPRMTSPKEKAAETAIDTRGFDPLEFASDKQNVPAQFPNDAALRGTSITPSDGSEIDSTFAIGIEDVPDEVDSLNSQAYRVQLFSSKVYGEARQEKIIAEEIFDRPLFLDYEVPYYKLRVGNFADRDKAERYQQRAKAAGYANAWVVVVIINKQSAPALYENDSLNLYLPDTTIAADSLLNEE